MSETNPRESGSPHATGQWFITTQWSVILAAGGTDHPRATAALEKLCRSYWAPIYTYLRRRGHQRPRAQDLTQVFFIWLLEKDHLTRVGVDQGRFRNFLLGYLKYYLKNESHREASQRRGGQEQFVPLEALLESEENQLAGTDDSSPELLYEKRWAKAVLERSLARLRKHYAATGKGELFDVLKDLQPGIHSEETYAGIGRRFGLTEAGIKTAVRRLRRRHAEIVREEIAATVKSRVEVDEEIRHIMRVLGT